MNIDMRRSKASRRAACSKAWCSRKALHALRRAVLGVGDSSSDSYWTGRATGFALAFDLVFAFVLGAGGGSSISGISATGATGATGGVDTVVGGFSPNKSLLGGVLT
jgi:hypothetical protein